MFENVKKMAEMAEIIEDQQKLLDKKDTEIDRLRIRISAQDARLFDFGEELSKQKEENEKLKLKYSELLNKYIDLLEKCARLEGAYDKHGKKDLQPSP